MGRPCTKAGDVSAFRARNVDFIFFIFIINTHFFRGFRSITRQPDVPRWCGIRRGPKLRDQPQDVGEQISRNRDPDHPEGDITAVSQDRSPGIAPMCRLGNATKL